MSGKKAERNHLTIAPLSKKINSNHKKFKPHKRNFQVNTHNPSNSRNGPVEGFKKQGTCHLVKERVTT